MNIVASAPFGGSGTLFFLHCNSSSIFLEDLTLPKRGAHHMDPVATGVAKWFGGLSIVGSVSPKLSVDGKIDGKKVAAVVGAIGTVAAAVISLITSLGAVDWSAAQISLVTAETAAVIALVTAILAHFWPNTQQQPVAVAGACTALITATLSLGTGFAWWTFTQAQSSAMVAVVSAVIGLGSALFARSMVTAKKTPPSAP
jgi:hypothetical protein